MVKAADKPARLEISDGSNDMWPMPVKRGLAMTMMVAAEEGFSLLCAVGLEHKEKRLTAFFSPVTSQNPDLDQMCDDIAEMFHQMAKRLRQ